MIALINCATTKEEAQSYYYELYNDMNRADAYSRDTALIDIRNEELGLITALMRKEFDDNSYEKHLKDIAKKVR